MHCGADPNPHDPKALALRFYAALELSDIEALTQCLSPDIRWSEPARFPYCGGTWTGLRAVMDNVFRSLSSEWNGFQAHPQSFISEGDRVVVLGDYSATHRTTGIEVSAPFVHVWTVDSGTLTQFVMQTDTAKFLEATRPLPVSTSVDSAAC